MKFVVPIDFTETTTTALRYALNLAKTFKADLVMVHVIPPKASEEEEREKKRELILLGDQIVLNEAFWEAVVRRGSIFETIAEVANEKDASLTVMGTHGALGMQKLFGSYAIKVITSSNTPFIITQDGYQVKKEIKSILVPIDLKNEDPRVLEVVAALAKPHKAKVHILTSFTKKRDEKKMSHQIATYAEGFFKERNIDCKVKHASKTDHFDEYLVNFAQDVEADLIAIINKGEQGYRNLFGTNFDQNIITNPYNIPVLTLDPGSEFLGEAFAS